jgi:5-formyltetrahydrofolate cyclo-ligase
MQQEYATGQRMQQAKACLRRRLLAKRAMLSTAKIQRKSMQIAMGVYALPAFQASPTIMVYMALAQEVQTADIIAEARRQKKRVVVPIIRGATLIAVDLPLQSEHLRRGPFGILEPCWQGSGVQPREIPFVIVPGIAFDRQGGRLGFGKGYYDRFLRQVPAPTFACALAFAMQIVPEIPQMAHDIRMHGIMTEQEFIPCQDHPTGPA